MGKPATDGHGNDYQALLCRSGMIGEDRLASTGNAALAARAGLSVPEHWD